MRVFKRVFDMTDHVESVYLRHEGSEGRFVCRHPKFAFLGDFLVNLDGVKKHLKPVQVVNLYK
jgi:hypothetical protein